ncbi:MAG: SUMF1/EgtB/PvdO family nonheme iron enzyme [Verrucomicrobiae bacterium]|nr:SUMF1/EgtB/PvdO family nonheme iron enzyme [Verrucomicrobiae bacterium]
MKKQTNLFMPFRKTLSVLLILVTAVLVCADARGDQFGSGDNIFEVDFVTIGAPGNPPFSEGRPYGVVDYVYRLAKYEVSLDLITKANAEGQLGLPQSLDEAIEAAPRPAMAATGLSWNHAARFINWLNEEKGFPHAYKFAIQPGEEGYDPNANIIPWNDGDTGYDPDNPFRNRHCRYHLPSFAERFKAAYFKPLGDDSDGVYTTYANGTNVEPVPVAGGTEPVTAVWHQPLAQGPADVNNAGGLSSWGVMALEGNVSEWEETTLDLKNKDGAAARAISGGKWFGIIHPEVGLSAIGSRSWTSEIPPGTTITTVGFRVASRVVNRPTPTTFRMESITRRNANLQMTWNDLGNGWAYTPQKRDLNEESEWTAVASRYRWPSPATQWTEVGAISPGVPSSGMLYRISAEKPAAPNRGKLIRSERMHSLTMAASRSRLAGHSYPTDEVRWGVDIFKIVYETVDPFGFSITASGALLVPSSTDEMLPLMSWQHGTEIYKGSPPSARDSVPSEANSYYHELGIFFASSGYVTAMPDYIGLGDSPGLHPYLHAATEASAVVDLLRAVRTFCGDNGIRLNDQLFLAGYSQGGHATVAAHREIEQHHHEEFTVTSSAPMAGPYDMSASLRYLLSTPDYPTPLFFAYVLAAWMPIYELGETLEEFFAPTFDQRLVPKLDGNATFDDVHAAMAVDVATALDPSFLQNIRSHSEHAFWQAAGFNSPLDWAPVAPMRLFHCSGDEAVPFANAEAAKGAYESNGACCVEIIDPSPAGSNWTHSDCYRPSIIAAKAWFDQMRQ